jgi:heparanase 1
MRSWLAASALATALGLGWLRGRTSEVLAASDPVVAATLALMYPQPARAPAATGQPVVLTIDGHQARAEVDERFLSVALDTSQVLGGHWWSSDARGVEFGRGDERTAPFDFARPRLRRLAAALAPAYLRIGGTEADVAYYDMSAGESHSAPSPYQLVLTRARWDAVNEFARAAGYDVLFTVNAGPGPRARDGRWSPENAESLLDYTRAAGYRVPVWELGNEVDSYWFTHGLSSRVSGRQYAEDLALFGSRVHAIFPQGRVAGPAAFYWPITGEGVSIGSSFMTDFLDAGGARADIVTWHFYPQQSRRCPVATRRASATRLLDPAALDEAARWADEIHGLTAARAPHAELWLDETGNAQCGGEPGISDRFVASLWWVDELGLAATHGQRVVVRQTLAGSNYGLIDDERVAPNPDYWASLLWKRLMGRVVLAVHPAGDDPAVRAYAHCTPDGGGGMSLLVVNLHSDQHARVRVEGYDTSGARLYRVTAPSLTSADVLLNGEPLRFHDDVPAIEPQMGAVTDGTIDLPEASYAFAVLPDANAGACKRGSSFLP